MSTLNRGLFRCPFFVCMTDFCFNRTIEKRGRKMTDTTEEVLSIPLVVHEQASYRLGRILRWCITGWAVSVLGLAAVLLVVMI